MTPAADRAGGRWQRMRAPAILLAPGVLLFLLFVVYPIVASLALSLYQWDGIGPKHWVGLANYRELAGDPVIRTALANNALWLAGYLVAPVLGLALALLLNQTMTGMRLVRSLFFMPFVLSQVVVGLVFGWFFNAQFGLFNVLLGGLGLPPAAPLENECCAIITVVLAGLWPQTAYCLILYLAGLAAIDGELIDAARLDGARGFALLRHVVLPQLRPVNFIVAMVCLVGALRSFDLVMIMTSGGPYNSSTVLAYVMYEQTFLSSRYGYAAAIATLLFLLMGGGVGMALWRLLRRESG